jgi:hypothetical protein
VVVERGEGRGYGRICCGQLGLVCGFVFKIWVMGYVRVIRFRWFLHVLTLTLGKWVASDRFGILV